MEDIQVNFISESVHRVEISEETMNVEPESQAGEETINTEGEGQSNKRSKSDVWDVFTSYKTPNGQIRARCICGRNYATDPKRDGTTNLRKHKLVCAKVRARNAYVDMNQMMLSHDAKVRSRKIDQMVCREMLVKAIVIHNLPFSIVEYEGFREWATYMNPDFKHICRNTAKADMLKIYNREKDKLKGILAELKGRICLTTDLWTSIIGDGYMTVTVHFVDESWKLHSRIIKFGHFAPPHTGVALCEKMMDVMKEWGIEKKVFSLTLDNVSSNDTMQNCLKQRLRADDWLLCVGKHFHIRCCAHILNLIVLEGLKVIESGLKKIRDSVRYVRASESIKITFGKCVEQMKIESKIGLRIDVPTRWNSTFSMLESALLYRKAFEQFQFMDDGYKSLPSEEEWDRGEKLCEFFRPFAEITNLFSGREYVTSNLYFLYVWRIQFNLVEESQSADALISDMAINMKKKFDKYWDEYSSVLAFALALDPRYKFDFIVFCYEKFDLTCSKTISKAKVARVRKELYELYEEYSKLITTPSSSSLVRSQASNSTSKPTKRNPDADFDVFNNGQCHGTKSELDIYLEDARYSRVQYPNLDVLTYWKDRRDRYPILSLMARDILSITITTVASESAFSMGSRLLTKYRSCILPSNVEALICLQNWLCGYEVEEAPEVSEFTSDEDLVTQFSNMCNIQSESIGVDES